MCANVPAQHAIQTALGGYQSINESDRAGRTVLRAGDARRPAPQRDPRRLLGAALGRALLLPAPGPRGLRDRRRRAVRHRACCAPRRSWSPTAPASTGSRPTTSGWSPCRTWTCWRRPSGGSRTSWPPAAEFCSPGAIPPVRSA
ncbi:hypothetical protein [Nocardioides convexus]|uniref:hypothetical protein n=1 Tax=Nocardioides convexus TaxID=2712224 RepID=UPI002418B320|nr:hypothetical protein [Nocardioides convexus]